MAKKCDSETEGSSGTINRRDFLKTVGQTALGAATLQFIPSRIVGAEGKITIASVGDCLIARRFYSYEEEEAFRPLLKILRSADVTFGNFETTIEDPEATPEGIEGCPMKCDPLIADDLKWAGFDLLGLCNNHSLDYGIKGLLATIRHLDRAGIKHAGTGRNLGEAGAPAYLEAADGRVGLVACASTFPSWWPASRGHSEIKGRPGLNPLHVQTTYCLPREKMEILKEIQGDLFQRREAQDREGGFSFLGNRFVEGALDIRREVDKKDAGEIITSIRRASRTADMVLLSLHAHEAYRSQEIPDRFLPEFAHSCIDAGADLFIGHGPHVLRGVEIYKGKPIFYSLGNFFFEAEGMKQVPMQIYEKYGLTSLDPSDFFNIVMKNYAAQSMWESVIAVASFENKRLTDLKFHPVDLHSEASRSVRGRPMMADKDMGEKIIRRLARLSDSFGTKINYQDGFGWVSL